MNSHSPVTYTRIVIGSLTVAVMFTTAVRASSSGSLQANVVTKALRTVSQAVKTAARRVRPKLAPRPPSERKEIPVATGILLLDDCESGRTGRMCYPSEACAQVGAQGATPCRLRESDPYDGCCLWPNTAAPVYPQPGPVPSVMMLREFPPLTSPPEPKRERQPAPQEQPPVQEPPQNPQPPARQPDRPAENPPRPPEFLPLLNPIGPRAAPGVKGSDDEDRLRRIGEGRWQKVQPESFLAPPLPPRPEEE